MSKNNLEQILGKEGVMIDNSGKTLKQGSGYNNSVVHMFKANYDHVMKSELGNGLRSKFGAEVPYTGIFAADLSAHGAAAMYAQDGDKTYLGVNSSYFHKTSKAEKAYEAMHEYLHAKKVGDNPVYGKPEMSGYKPNTQPYHAPNSSPYGIPVNHESPLMLYLPKRKKEEDEEILRGAWNQISNAGKYAPPMNYPKTYKGNNLEGKVHSGQLPTTGQVLDEKAVNQIIINYVDGLLNSKDKGYSAVKEYVSSPEEAVKFLNEIKSCAYKDIAARGYEVPKGYNLQGGYKNLEGMASEDYASPLTKGKGNSSSEPNYGANLVNNKGGSGYSAPNISGGYGPARTGTYG